MPKPKKPAKPKKSQPPSALIQQVRKFREEDRKTSERYARLHEATVARLSGPVEFDWCSKCKVVRDGTYCVDCGSKLLTHTDVRGAK
ncbi:MAG: hypothetical protein SGI88_02085 [Candidatus Hydrogenedentes bacterium]|nr:hypothetical protein [Candidatus Hydrogenedentota bacterium]